MFHEGILCPYCGYLSGELINLIKKNPQETIQYLCPSCGVTFTIAYMTNKKIKKIEKIYEICICAAVKATDGTIIRGHRHRDCRDIIVRKGKKPAKNWHGDGFITSLGRFVNRSEGYKLQIDARIESANPEGYQHCEWLFSEDLY